MLTGAYISLCLSVHVCTLLFSSSHCLCVQAPPKEHPKDPLAPKPNKTPFNFFSVDARQKAKESYPELTQTEVTKKVINPSVPLPPILTINIVPTDDSLSFPHVSSWHAALRSCIFAHARGQFQSVRLIRGSSPCSDGIAVTWPFTHMQVS